MPENICVLSGKPIGKTVPYVLLIAYGGTHHHASLQAFNHILGRKVTLVNGRDPYDSGILEPVGIGERGATFTVRLDNCNLELRSKLWNTAPILRVVVSPHQSPLAGIPVPFPTIRSASV